jgi:hypothetical protein
VRHSDGKQGVGHVLMHLSAIQPVVVCFHIACTAVTRAYAQRWAARTQSLAFVQGWRCCKGWIDEPDYWSLYFQEQQPPPYARGPAIYLPPPPPEHSR